MARLSYGPNARKIPDWAEQWVLRAFNAVGIESGTLTSTIRTAHDQARIMVENYGDGSDPPGPNSDARSLYSSATSRKVIEAWAEAADDLDTKAEVIDAVEAAIQNFGYMSDHMNPRFVTIDIGPNSIHPKGLTGDLVDYAKSRPPTEVKVSQVFGPGQKDAAVHIPLIPPEGVSDGPEGTTGMGFDPDDVEGEDKPGVMGSLMRMGLAFLAGKYAYTAWKKRRRSP